MIDQGSKDKDMTFYEQYNWFAVHTKSKHEKLATSLLLSKGIEAYLPIRKVVQKWSDRKKLVEFPLFKGYFFVKIRPVDKQDILNIKGVVRVLGGTAPEPIPSDQIETLKKFENNEIEVDPYMHLQPGNLVRISKGPFKGCVGSLVSKKNKYRLYVNMKLIMQSASVEIDAEDVEKI